MGRALIFVHCIEFDTVFDPTLSLFDYATLAGVSFLPVLKFSGRLSKLAKLAAVILAGIGCQNDGCQNGGCHYRWTSKIFRQALKICQNGRLPK